MLRFTSRSGFPVDAQVLQQSGGLFGGSVEPFASEGVPVSPNLASSAVRCQSCGGYWWPGCNWRGNSTWICGLCGEENAVGKRMPSPDELREFVMLYKDEDKTEKSIVYFFLLDLESDEAFLDAAVFAIGTAVGSIPPNVKVGFAVSSADTLTVYEFSEFSESYAAVTTRLTTTTDGKFRCELSEATSISVATCAVNSLGFVRALNSLNIRRDTQKNKASCIGRSIEAVAKFLASSNELIFGARVFAMSTNLRASVPDAEALSRTMMVCCGEVGVGVDFFYVSPTNTSVVDDCIRTIVHGTGGALYDHSFAELDSGALARDLSSSCSQQIAFCGMVKARTCPELIVVSSGKRGGIRSRAGNLFRASSSSHTPAVEEGKGGAWWLVSLLKNVALSFISTIGSSNGDDHTPQGVSSSSNIFLGKGQTIPQDWVWSVPCVNLKNCSLAFELAFTSSNGLTFFSYPRAMAVQVASTFVMSDGSRYVRVETRSCETDRPSRSVTEIWHTADWRQYAFLLVRLLVFSNQYQVVDFKDVVLDWAARAISSGCGLERFDRKLGKQLYGLVRLLDANDSSRMRLIAECDPSDLDKLLWPQLLSYPNGKLGLSLSLKTIQESESTLVLDACSDIFVISHDGPISTDEEVSVRGHAEKLVERSKHPCALHFLTKSSLFAVSMTSPVGVNTHLDARERFMSLLLEEPSSDWPEAYGSFQAILAARDVNKH